MDVVFLRDVSRTESVRKNGSRDSKGEGERVRNGDLLLVEVVRDNLLLAMRCLEQPQEILQELITIILYEGFGVLAHDHHVPNVRLGHAVHPNHAVSTSPGGERKRRERDGGVLLRT